MCYSLRVFFFRQKTAYELRISDWSSDVCSSDLTGLSDPGDGRRRSRSQHRGAERLRNRRQPAAPRARHAGPVGPARLRHGGGHRAGARLAGGAWMSVGEEKGVSVRGEYGGRRLIEKKQHRIRVLRKSSTI